MAGVSLSEYLRATLARAAARPTPEELEARIDAREKVTLPIPVAQLVREIREHGE